jgi:hypothetical protein
VPFFYQSGDEIRKGDRVTYHGEPAEIEFVADKISGNSKIDVHVREHGRGAMIIERKFFGRVFVHDTEDEEDIIFVARAELS